LRRKRVGTIADAQWLEDRDIVARTFLEKFGRKLDLDNPKTFNEKIAFKILFDRRPILTRITDKIRARDFVAERIGPDYLTRIYQICRTPQQIDWQALPQSFVIKTNHGAAMNTLVPDKSKVSLDRLIPTLERWLRANIYYEYRREWSYLDIVPCLFIEEFLRHASGKVPADFKFYVFDGEATYLQMHFGRFSNHRSNFYNRDLRRLDVRLQYPSYEERVTFPPNIEEMFALADRLGRGFDFVRVDLYNVGGRIVFGELTNYPDGGLGIFDPPVFDAIFGSRWRLPARYVDFPPLTT